MNVIEKCNGCTAGRPEEQTDFPSKTVPTGQMAVPRQWRGVQIG